MNNSQLEYLSKEQLILAETRIRAIEKQIQDTREVGGIFSGWKIKRLEKELKKRDDLQFENVDIHLYRESKEYREIGTSNLMLFENKAIRFSVDTKVNILGSYSRQLNGSIHSNGHAYLYASNINSIFQPFGCLRYASKLQGTLDRWGRLETRIVHSSTSLFKNLPSRYEGRVDVSGNIVLDCVESEFDIFHNCRMEIHKLVGNIIQDPVKLRHFETNKQKMVELIESFRVELLR